MAGRRGYTFCIVAYQSEEEVSSFCETYTKKYAYILHDQDEADPHYHIVCTFAGNRSYSSIRALWNEEAGNVFIEECKDRFASYTYLTHADNPDKHSYNEEDIVTNDRAFFKGREQGRSTEQFLQDLLNDTPLTDMAIMYGKDFMRNYQKYMQYKQAVINEQRRKDAQNGTVQIKYMIYQDYILSHCKDCPDRNTLACQGAKRCMITKP